MTGIMDGAHGVIPMPTGSPEEDVRQAVERALAFASERGCVDMCIVLTAPDGQHHIAVQLDTLDRMIGVLQEVRTAYFEAD